MSRTRYQMELESSIQSMMQDKVSDGEIMINLLTEIAVQLARIGSALEDLISQGDRQ